MASQANLEHKDKRKKTPVLLAVAAGRAVEASMLLNHGANPDAADDSGNTVSHYGHKPATVPFTLSNFQRCAFAAAAFGWGECLSLLKRAGAQLHVANQMKLMPITAALMKVAATSSPTRASLPVARATWASSGKCWSSASMSTSAMGTARPF